MAGHRRDDEFSIPFHAFFISRQRGRKRLEYNQNKNGRRDSRGRYRTAGHGLEKDAVWQQTSFRYHVFFFSVAVV